MIWSITCSDQINSLMNPTSENEWNILSVPGYSTSMIFYPICQEHKIIYSRAKVQTKKISCHSKVDQQTLKVLRIKSQRFPAPILDS